MTGGATGPSLSLFADAHCAARSVPELKGALVEGWTDGAGSFGDGRGEDLAGTGMETGCGGDSLSELADAHCAAKDSRLREDTGGDTGVDPIETEDEIREGTGGDGEGMASRVVARGIGGDGEGRSLSAFTAAHADARDDGSTDAFGNELAKEGEERVEGTDSLMGSGACRGGLLGRDAVIGCARGEGGVGAGRTSLS